MSLKPLNQLAAEILVDWKDNPSTARHRVYAFPYVEAMLSMKTCNDRYGLEYGDMIVAYALNNLAHWRGDKAKEVKAALNQHLKEHNAKHHSA